VLIPAAPTGNYAGPLIGPEYYTNVTNGDTVPQSVLTEAQTMVEQHLDRTLSYGSYLERLYVTKAGMVFPSATPFDPNAGLSPDSGIVQGAGIWIGYFTPLPDLPLWLSTVPPQTDVSYTGGFQPQGTGGTGPTPDVPPLLARCIVKVAWYTNNPALLPGQPGGVKSMSLNGVSISGDLASMISMDGSLRRDLARWRRPHVRGW
jgi:hypothetical protein